MNWESLLLLEINFWLRELPASVSLIDGFRGRMAEKPRPSQIAN
jgi:hypothetical protein